MTPPHALRAATPEDLDFIRRVHAEAMRPHVERAFGAWDDAQQRARLLETTRPETHEIVAPEEAAIRVRVWLTETRPRILNVAGPRLSEVPRIAEHAGQVLRAALTPWLTPPEGERRCP